MLCLSVVLSSASGAASFGKLFASSHVPLWLGVQFQCNHLHSMAHVVLSLSNRATTVCLAPGSRSLADDNVLAPLAYFLALG